jgi:hypothetical protein
MRIDSRLRLGRRESDRYWETIETQTGEFDRSVDEESWQRVVDPLVALVIGKLDGNAMDELQFPEGGDASLEEAFITVRDRILKFRGLCCSEDPSERALIKRLARGCARELPSDLEKWIQAEVLFHTSLNGAEFLKSIPANQIEDQMKSLVQATATLQNGLTEPDLSEEFLSGIDSRLANDRVERALKLRRESDQGWLGSRCRIISALLDRSPANWFRWLDILPHPLIQQIALNSVEDLDFLDGLLERKLADQTAGAEDLLLPSIVWRIVWLWEEIERALDDMIRTNGEGAAELRSHWVEIELPMRVRGLRDRLESQGQGIEIAGFILRYLTTFRGPQFADFQCLSQFREELLSLFGERNETESSTILLPNCTKASLIAAGVLAIRQPSPGRLTSVLHSYRQWLESAVQVWYGTFEADDKELLGVLAGVLALHDDPLQVAREIIESVVQPSEGWHFNYEGWSRSVSQLSHALVLISLAAVRIIDERGRNQNSSELMDFAWNQFHSMIQNGSLGPRRSEVGSPTVFIWACAGRALDGLDEKAARAIEVFEDPRLVLSAAENLKLNTEVFSDSLKRAVQQEAERLLTFFHHARNFAAKEEGPLRERLVKLVA